MEDQIVPSIANRLSNLPLEELGNLATTLKDLQRHPGWAVLQDLLGAEMRDLDRKLDSATRFEHADYALHHGRRYGIGLAKNAVSTVVALFEKRDQENEQRLAAADAGGSR